ncbi:related to GPI anchored dioxygenase [Phialocephala subalpina]|uniref:Related to GPI anchored dioxygenase n=1 Tax=Phialocephala subalpina TaxID=576137 RepID=A0A1L7XDH7_9HELO|nr:related to GPI anchored dioxygenase [Phialocephala subalpina]
MVAFNSLVALLATVPLILAHPGENVEAIKAEMVKRNAQHAAATRSLSECQNSAEALALRERSAARRAAKVTELRRKRGLTTEPLSHRKRDLTSLEYWTQQNHNESGLSYTLSTPETTIFASNNTCALVPETTIGPYYVTGEQIRSNITEGQAGVPMHIELQFVDMNTCSPVSSLLADIWHCNSTGVYSGIDTSEGEGGLNSTFLRGVQVSDDEGAVAFDTLFPGHYDDRVTHLHLVIQTNSTILPNNTYTGGTTLHVGQIYFEDALVEAVEATSPYNTNTIAFTTWEEDGWMLEEATTDYDPFVEYVQLSGNLEDGLLAWITVAVDLSSDHSANLTAAAHYYGTGGVAVSGSSKGLPPSNPNAS